MTFLSVPNLHNLLIKLIYLDFQIQTSPWPEATLSIISLLKTFNLDRNIRLENPILNLGPELWQSEVSKMFFFVIESSREAICFLRNYRLQNFH